MTDQSSTPATDAEAERTRLVSKVEQTTYEDTVGAPAASNVPAERLASLARGAVAPQDGADDPHRRAIGSDAPGEGKSRSAGRAFLAAFLVTVAVMGIVAAATYGAELWGGKTVPSVLGKSEAAATQALRQKGFEVAVQTRLVDDAVGVALQTDPPAGQRINAGSTVTLYLGVVRAVPEVAGLSLADAQAALEAAGATNIILTYEASSAPEGTVTAVDPAPGASFAAADPVTLTVAQAYTVPYVTGKQEDEAVQAIEAAGLVARVTYANGRQPAGTVMATSPQQGQRIEAGQEVELKVSAPRPADYHHLAELLNTSGRGLSELLKEHEFAVTSASIGEDGMLTAQYASPSAGTLTFTAEPFASHYYNDSGDTTDYLAQGKNFRGIRLELPASEAPAGTAEQSSEALQEALALFGFSGLRETVDQQSVRLPEGTPRTAPSYVCAFGQMGDTCWTVLLTTRAGEPYVAASAGPSAIYADFDLTPYGGSVCSMVAYYQMYTG